MRLSDYVNGMRKANEKWEKNCVVKRNKKVSIRHTISTRIHTVNFKCEQNDFDEAKSFFFRSSHLYRALEKALKHTQFLVVHHLCIRCACYAYIHGLVMLFSLWSSTSYKKHFENDFSPNFQYAFSHSHTNALAFAHRTHNVMELFTFSFLAKGKLIFFPLSPTEYLYVFV